MLARDVADVSKLEIEVLHAMAQWYAEMGYIVAAAEVYVRAERCRQCALIEVLEPV